MTEDTLLNLRMQVRLDVERYLEDGFHPVELAAILITQGLALYRNMFNDEEYEIMVKDIYDRRNMVRKVNP